MKPKPYPSDLTDAQWAILKPLLPQARPLGRPRKTGLREIVDGILYRNRSGLLVTVSEGTTFSVRRGPGQNLCVSAKWSQPVQVMAFFRDLT